ncbi:DUF6683 family protein [Sphingomonas pokkalii]|uniref:DUF6683 family protein n=1 Tax=Sphingomonas pokkalii TaxID=2175090 RepID=UPI0019D1BBFE|nr:DUF6683 family protein [Sphingomonas pokkalii]
MKRFLAGALLALAAGWTPPAAAQIVDGWSWSVLVPSIGKTDQLGMLLEDRKRQDQARGGPMTRRAPDLAATRAAPLPDMSVLHYTPSRTRRSANLAAFVQKTRAVDPQGAADMQKVFAEGDFIERIGALVRPLGLRIDNVADAYTCWWINAWQAAHGQYDETKPALAATVRAQAARAIGATPEIARASEAQKQEFAEALWVQAALIEVAVEQAKGNPARLREIGDAVRKGARHMGLNLDAIELTSRGFVPADVGRNDPPAAVPGADKATPYGALALAAGGVGVGGFLLLRQRRG